jgi:hypothetical protein
MRIAIVIKGEGLADESGKAIEKEWKKIYEYECCLL